MWLEGYRDSPETFTSVSDHHPTRLAGPSRISGKDDGISSCPSALLTDIGPELLSRIDIRSRSFVRRLSSSWRGAVNMIQDLVVRAPSLSKDGAE
jgi:hypothetical protein